MHHDELLSICTQMTQYIIVDQVIRYLIVIPFLLTLSISFFVFRKNQQKTLEYKRRMVKKLPKTVEQCSTIFHIPRTIFQIIHSQKPIAETTGIFSKKIILSTDLIRTLSKKQLEAVILHELYHLQHQHPLAKILLQILTSIFFFFPFVKEFAQHVLLRMEISADNFAVSVQHSKAPIQSALLSLLSSDKRPINFAVAFADNSVRSRILALTKGIHPTLCLRKKTMLTTVASFLFFASLFFAQQTLANTVDQSLVGKELRSSCSFFQCVTNCQESVKLYSENINMSQ